MDAGITAVIELPGASGDRPARLCPTEDLLTLLRSVRLLAGVPLAELPGVAARLRPVRFAAGETIVQAGDASDTCYVIQTGRAGAVALDQIGQEVTLATFEAGQSFGEMGLVAGGKRNATVRALEPVEALALTRATFLRLERICPAFGESVRREVRLLAIDAVLRTASPFAHLPGDAIRGVAGRMRQERAAAGQAIIREGELGDRFYLLRAGCVEVLKQGRRVQVLEAGDCFGEAAPLARVRRTATVRALEDVELLSMNRADFTSVVATHPILRQQFRELVRIRVGEGLARSIEAGDPVHALVSSLVRLRGRRYWWLLASGIASFAVLSVLAASTRSPGLALATLIVGALVGPVAYVAYLAESHLLPDPPACLAVTFLLSAGLGIPVAGVLELVLPANNGIPDTLVAVAVIEEAAKLIGVAWVLSRSSARFQMDGVVYGAAAGMGFAALENLLYGLQRIGSPELLVMTLWVRVLMSPFSHGTWTAITCAAIWKQKKLGGSLHAPWVVLAFGAAVGLHALWNWQPIRGPGLLLWLLGVGVAGLVVLGHILEQARREELLAVVALNPELSNASAGTARAACRACRQVAPPGTHYCARCGVALRRAGHGSAAGGGSTD